MTTSRPSPPPGRNPGERADRLLPWALFGAVTAIYLPALSHGFITYDDPVYVTENPHVAAGLTWEGVRWAFSSVEASNWHPLTWLSHIADVQVFGMHAWGHHLTNVLLHALNTALLYLALRRMTGSSWRSACAAALFGVHPLHVESVAWIAERKDVLSGTFWLLALIAYAGYAERAMEKAAAWKSYCATLLFFAMGLMSKPMVVTLPCVLLLLDYWPLGRWKRPWRILAEKVPFFILSAASCAITLQAQGRGGTVASPDDFPFPVRVANALSAYCSYLGKCFFPFRLAVFYPSFAELPPLHDTVLAATLLAAVTAVACALLRKRPYLIIGWLWYLGTLVPVIGLVQVGGQAMADRYSYLPLVGIFIAVAWGAGDIAGLFPRWRQGLVAAGIALGLILSAVAERQLAFWRSGETLFRHAIAVTRDNWAAHANLYATLSRESDPGAKEELRATMNILAGFAEKYDRRGAELEKTPGHSAEALKAYREAVRIMPDLAEPHEILGAALAKTKGGMPEAIAEFREAVRLAPQSGNAHSDLATALASSPGDRSEAVTEYETVTILSPGDFKAHFNLGFLLSGVPDRERESASEYGEAVRIRPDSVEARFNYGLALARIPGRKDEAIKQFREVLRLRPDLVQARQMIGRLQ